MINHTAYTTHSYFQNKSLYRVAFLKNKSFYLTKLNRFNTVLPLHSIQFSILVAAMSMVQEQPVSYKAAAWTVGVHLLLLLLFYLINYTVPQLEPMDDMGVEVNLGTFADGFGDDQPMAVGAPAPETSTAPQMNNAATNALPDNIIESNDPDAPAINTNTNINNADKNNNVNSNRSNNATRPATTNNQPAPKPKYQYTGAAGDGGNNAGNNVSGSSEGNTTGNGDRGVPGGTAGADNYEGTPGNGGRGFNFDLEGRYIVAAPSPDANFKESGKVVLRITVNRDGIITNKRVESASNTQLRNIALEKISKIRFNKSSTATEEQFGSITFVFKTRS